ncbi:MAG: BatA domain-containing protein [Acidobacteria bacterium]|nr:BatA domain-containing protein [Acidobacteriota bacterium]
MSFLNPLLLLGLGAIAIPILVHLIQRERKRVVAFPSLMFVRRIPYQSVRRRRVRHWLLLAMRAGAIALIVAAFARPFLRRSAAAAAAGGGSRELVVLLDRSASMGYGDRWQRAQEAARQAIRSLAGDERATLVLFSRNAEENMRATTDHARLEAAIGEAKVGAGATRYGPAIKLAESILAQSPAPRREAVLVSDFQRSGWSGSEDARFPEGMTLTPVPVGDGETANLAVPSAAFQRASFSGQERITVSAGLSNKGRDPMNDVPVTLSIDGHEIQTQRVSIAPGTSASVTFTPFTLTEPNVRGTIRAGDDLLPADNVFHFVLDPSAPISILVVDSGADAGSSLYLSEALAVGSTPAFAVDVVPAARVVPEQLNGRSVIVLNDTPVPPAAGTGPLQAFVERGGGLLVVLGDRSSWPQNDATLLPGKVGPPTDPPGGRVVSIGFRDYGHEVFEIFKAPRSGDLTAAHVFRYRALEPSPDARVLARFDDGAVAGAERRVGEGRVIVWTSTLDDSWNDLALKPVYLPLVHQIVRYLAQYRQPRSWQTVGQVLDLAEPGRGTGERVIVTPAGDRITQDGETGLLELDQQGIYEVRRDEGGRDAARPQAIAVNLDPAESDLSPIDPAELVASVTGRAAAPAAAAAAAAPEATREDAERRQRLWWYLLTAGMLLLAAEMVVANRLSRREKFL